jgi:hypothetical protein
MKLEITFASLIAATLLAAIPAVGGETDEATHESVIEGHGAVGHDMTGAAMGGETIGALRRSIPFDMGQRNVKSIVMDGREVWIGTSSGAIRYDSHRGSYQTYDNRTGLLSNGVFHLSKQGDEIWVGTYGGGLSILDPKTETWRNYNIPQGLGDAFVYDALTMSNGDVWIATWSGANRIRGGAMDDPAAWDLYTVENTGGGLPNDWVYGLAEGKDGQVWMATEGGLARFQNETWTNWTHADGLGAELEMVEADITFGRLQSQLHRGADGGRRRGGLGRHLGCGAQPVRWRDLACLHRLRRAAGQPRVLTSHRRARADLDRHQQGPCDL